MSVVERIFPKRASNDYRGSVVALYAFPLVLCVFTFRSLVHFLKDDSGVHSIATFHVFPVGEIDPNQVIHLYSSLWGTQQLLTLFVAVLVLWRYRNLIPFMWGLFAVEILLRLAAGAIHPLTPDYYASRPPGAVGNLPMLAVFSLMFGLSLRTSTASSLSEAKRAEPARS